MTLKKITYIDSGLSDNSGHYLTELKKNKNAFLQKGFIQYSVGFLEPKNPDLMNEHQIVPLIQVDKFDWRNYSQDLLIPLFDSLMNSSLIISNDLKQINGIEESDIIFVNNPTPAEVFGLILAFENFSDVNMPHLVFHVGNSSGITLEFNTSGEYIKWKVINLEDTQSFRFVSRRINSNIINKIHFVADDPLLAEAFEIALQRRVVIIPHNSLPILITSKDNISINIGFLGLPKISKGFAIIPDLIKYFTNNHDYQHINFIVQLGGDQLIEQQNEVRSLAINSDRIKIYEGTLSDIEYNQMFQLVDIVALPYNQPMYSAHTSGVFFEAISSGIPVVVPTNTTMSNRIRLEEAIGIIANSENLMDFIPAMEFAINDYNNLKQKSNTTSKIWNIKNCADTFAESIINICGKQLNTKLPWFNPDQSVNSEDDLLYVFANNASELAKSLKILYVIGAHLFQEEQIFEQLFPNLNKIILFEPIPELF